MGFLIIRYLKYICVDGLHYKFKLSSKRIKVLKLTKILLWLLLLLSLFIIIIILNFKISGFSVLPTGSYVILFLHDKQMNKIMVCK